MRPRCHLASESDQRLIVPRKFPRCTKHTPSLDSHISRVARMTRATRFASYASAVTTCYFLVWFSILPIPLIAEETKDQILPLVRTPQRITTGLYSTHDPVFRCSFRGGCWYLSGLIRWRRSDGGCGCSRIVLMRIRS